MSDTKKEVLAYPLNTASFGNVYYDATDAQTYTCTRTTGVYSADDNMRVIAVGGRNITVMEGLAWLNFDKFKGIAVANTITKNGVITFNIVPALTLPRIDRVIISYDYNEDRVDVLIRQGVAASNPQPPTIRRDGSYYEIVLADVSVSVGSGNIVQGNISDQRLNASLCGIMRDGVTGIPTQDLYNQFDHWLNSTKSDYNAWFNSTKNNFDAWFLQFRDQNQADFDAWFEAIKRELEDFDPVQVINDLNAIRGRVDVIERNYQRPQITRDDGGSAIPFVFNNLGQFLIDRRSGLYTFKSENRAGTDLPEINSEATLGISHFDRFGPGESSCWNLAFTNSGRAYWRTLRANLDVTRPDWNPWYRIASVFERSGDDWESLPIAAGWNNKGGALKGIKMALHENIVHLAYDIEFDDRGDLVFVYLPHQASPQHFLLGMCWVIDPVTGSGGVGSIGALGNSLTYYYNVTGPPLLTGRRIVGYLSYAANIT